MTNGACSAPGAPAFSIAFSIAEKWLISHEDESGTLHPATCSTGSSPLKKGRKVGVYEAVLPDPDPVTKMAGSPLGEKLLISWGFSCQWNNVADQEVLL